jgi:hypothetical protein
MTITYGDVRAHITSPTAERQTQPVRFALQEQAVIRLTPSRHGITLQCWSGVLWVTQEGDPADHLLAAGETFQTRRAGRVVAQAMESSLVGVSAE